MISTILGKAVASIATTGVLVAPLALASAPQFANVACDNPDSIATTTTVALDQNTAEYGAQTFATARVSAESGPRPTGQVAIEVVDRVIYLKDLNRGRAVKLLPRGLSAGTTYQVQATYAATCDWQGSASTTTDYTVTRTSTTPVPRVVAARRAQFSSTFNGGGGLPAKAGQARFSVRKNGVVVRVARDYLNKGVAEVDMDNLPRGRYTLRVKYLGSENYLKGRTQIRFRVR